MLSGYALYAPSTIISRENRTIFIKDKAAGLLQNSGYLQGEADASVIEFIVTVSQVIHPLLGEKITLQSPGYQASLPHGVLLEHQQVPSNVPGVSTVRAEESPRVGGCNGRSSLLSFAVANCGL